MLTRIARTAYRRRRLVVTAWVVGLVAAIMIGPTLAGDWSENDRLSGADSQQAYDLLQAHTPSGGDDGSNMVFDGVPGNTAAIDSFLTKVRTIPGVDRVGDLKLSEDGTVGMASLGLVDDEDSDATIVSIKEAAASLSGVKTSFSGYLFQIGEEPDSEMIGVLAALVILIIAFGSVVAAGLPVLVALFGVTIGGAVVGLIANVMHMGEVTQQVTTMISIGVGIDYTLLIVSRYRSALQRLGDPEEAVVEAIDYAGRAVLLAGTIVAISLMGLFTIGMATFSGLAVGAATGVLVAVLATITFAPALLGFVGPNINRLHIGRKRNISRTQNLRWASLVQGHAKFFTISGVAVLIVLAIPVFSLHLGSADDGTVAEGTTNRIAYDTVSRAFGPGFHGPILVVVDNPGDSLDSVTSTLRNTPGIVSVGQPQLSGDGAIAVLEAVPATGPSDRKTDALLKTLRSDIMPSLENNGMQIYLGGDTARDIDFAQRCADRMPIFVGTVLVLSFLLLMIVFRSIIIPLKAVAMNLLSLSAAGGVLIAVFQWGWAASLFGTSAGPVEPWIPELLFAIVFGLSMDYEIFLLTSIREAYRRGEDASSAILHGLGATTRIITAAAAIMTVVFASFIGIPDLAIKMIGFGLAVAIAIDATIVRLMLLPAAMTLLGDANWWLPKWLDRILPNWEPERHVELEMPAVRNAVAVTEPV